MLTKTEKKYWVERHTNLETHPIETYLMKWDDILDFAPEYNSEKWIARAKWYGDHGRQDLLGKMLWPNE